MNHFMLVAFFLSLSGVLQDNITVPTGAIGFRNPVPGLGVFLTDELSPTTKSWVCKRSDAEAIDASWSTTGGSTLNTQLVLDASKQVQSRICYNNFQLSIQSLFGDGGISSASRMANRSEVVGSTLYFLGSSIEREDALDSYSNLSPEFEQSVAAWNELDDGDMIRQLVAEKYGTHFVTHVVQGMRLSVACRSTSVESKSEQADEFAADFSASFGVFGSAEASVESVKKAIQSLSKYALEIRADLQSGGIVKHIKEGNETRIVVEVGAITMTNLYEVHELLQGLRGGKVQIKPAATSAVLAPIATAVPAKYEVVRKALGVGRIPTITEALNSMKSRIEVAEEDADRLARALQALSLKRVRTGTVNVGTGPGGDQPKVVTINFSPPFSGVPKIVATPKSVQASDIFSATVRHISNSSCTFHVGRIGTGDNIGHWGQSPRLNWIAWE